MLTTSQIADAVRNDYPDKSFKLGNREFPIHDLDYDSYIEFMELARPIIVSLANTITPVMKDQKLDFDLNYGKLDFGSLIKLAGNELPRMAHICCRQSDPKVSIADVKRLARRPHNLIEVVLLQVKHNELVKEFADFFPRLKESVLGLAPDTAEMTEQPSTTTE